MEFQDRGMVVEPAGQRIGQVHQPRSILDGAIHLGMAVHGGFGGKPRPPGPGVEQYRHEHKGGQGSRGIAHQCTEDIAAHPIALAQGKVAEDGH